MLSQLAGVVAERRPMKATSRPASAAAAHDTWGEDLKKMYMPSSCNVILFPSLEGFRNRIHSSCRTLDLEIIAVDLLFVPSSLF